MAVIKPLKAWRYNKELSLSIEEHTSPLFDVISKEQRDTLYGNPFNSIHLSVPLHSETPEAAHKTLESWKENGAIIQDKIPGIYVYYQYFSLPGGNKQYIRKGFVCWIKAKDWESSDSDILRHENTMPHSVNDRVEVLKATELNVSPTHGLYFDDDFTLEGFMDEAIENPIYEVEDYQGVKDVLAVIHDKTIISKFVDRLKSEKIILADGHHRMEGSMIHRKEMLKIYDNPEAAFNYHLMYLTNGSSDDLRILPTHRLINGLERFDKDNLLKRLAPYFEIKKLDNPYDVTEIILGKQWAFGLLFESETYKVRLKPECISELSWKFPDSIKKLDLTVMHYFILELGLEIPGKDQRKSENISFERNFGKCVKKVLKGEVQMAIITQDIDMQVVKEVCHSGYTLPQKSTYFYPKVICGFLFGSIKQDEFELPLDPGF